LFSYLFILISSDQPVKGSLEFRRKKDWVQEDGSNDVIEGRRGQRRSAEVI
jgi:hypothetical protein